MREGPTSEQIDAKSLGYSHQEIFLCAQEEPEAGARGGGWGWLCHEIIDAVMKSPRKEQDNLQQQQKKEQYEEKPKGKSLRGLFTLSSSSVPFQNPSEQKGKILFQFE